MVRAGDRMADTFLPDRGSRERPSREEGSMRGIRGGFRPRRARVAPSVAVLAALVFGRASLVRGGTADSLTSPPAPLHGSVAARPVASAGAAFPDSIAGVAPVPVV